MLKWLTLLTVAVIVAILLGEAVINASLRSPGRFPLSEAAARALYLREVRNVVQADTTCVRYDHEVTYVLRHGSCTFDNVEFTSTLRGNSEGLRDSEDALEAPQVIFLGDSYAMGWGVEEEEGFVRRLGDRTGLRTLNAGVSSFGTAREMRLLERLDTSALETLVIQYHPNDAPENRAFLDAGQLNAAPESRWREYVDGYQRRIRPTPGKRMLGALFYTLLSVRQPDLVRHLLGMDLSLSMEDEVDILVNTLASSPPPPEHVTVILFELNDYGWRRPEFPASLRRRLQGPDLPEWVKRLHVLDVEQRLPAGVWFPLDGHLTAEGHGAVAEVLRSDIWPSPSVRP
jgi:hypothetical protein